MIRPGTERSLAPPRDRFDTDPATFASGAEAQRHRNPPRHSQRSNMRFLNPLSLHAAALGAVLSLAAPGFAQEEAKAPPKPTTAAAATPSLMPYLPEGTVMAVSMPDLKTTMGEMAQMPIAKMWNEPDVQKFVAPLMAMVREQMDQLMAQGKEMHAAGQLPVDPSMMGSMRLDGMTFAITSVEMVKSDFGTSPSLGMLIHMDFGSSAEQMKALVSLGLNLMEQQAGEMMIKTETKIGDITLTSYESNGPMELTMGLNVAMLPTGIMIGTLKSDLAAALGAMEKGTPVLTQTPSYAEHTKGLVTEGTEMLMYVRNEKMLAFMMEAMSLYGEGAAGLEEMGLIDLAGVNRVMDALGVSSMKSFAMTSSYVNGRAEDRSFSSVPAAERKGLMGMSTKPLDMSFIKWVPKDVVSVRAMTMEPMVVHDTLMGAVTAYDETMGEGIKAQLAEMEKQVGFSVKDDLFGSMGDQLVYWSMPLAGLMSAPEMTLLMKVKDQARMLKVLEAMATMTDGAIELEKSDKRGIEQWSLRINADPSAEMEGMNLSELVNPTFAFKNGWMVMALSPGDVKRAMNRMDREDDPKGDIRGNKEFAPYVGKLPANAVSMSFLDWKAEFESLYQTLSFALSMIPASEDNPIDTTQLPEVSVLTQHLFGSMSWSTVDENGFRSEGTGPFGAEMYMMLAAVVGAATVVGNMGGF